MHKRVLASLGLGAVLVGASMGACTSTEADNGGTTNDAGSSETSVADVVIPDGGTADAADAATDAPSPYSARAQRGLDISPVPIPTTGLSTAQIEQLGQGSYLVNAVASCGDCHTPGGPPPIKFLAGGTPFPIDGANIVYARNLTPDPTTGMTLPEASFIAAMRTGKDFNTNPDAGGVGKILLVMPWAHFRWMSTADLKAIYAYLKVIPAVSNAVPADDKSASILNGAPSIEPTQYDEGDVTRPLPPETDDAGAPADPDGIARGLAIRPIDAPQDAGVADLQVIGRGAYLANIAACSDCHSNPERKESRPGQPNYLKMNTDAYLAGGRVFAVPPPLQAQLKQVRTMSADLIGLTNGFFNESDDTLARFVSIIKTGTHSDESVDGGPARLLGWPMPAAAFKNMLDSDLEAIYRYVKSIPGRSGANDKVTEDYARYCTADGDCDTANGETCAKGTLADAATAPSGECVGQACTTTTDCNACQTCTAATNTKCATGAANTACFANGL